MTARPSSYTPELAAKRITAEEWKTISLAEARDRLLTMEERVKFLEEQADTMWSVIYRMLKAQK